MFDLVINTSLKATYNIPAIQANVMWEYKRQLLNMALIMIISTQIMYHQAVSFARGQVQKQVVVGCSRWIDIF